MTTSKLVISAILCLTVSGCLFESNQNKIEALVDGPIREKLYSKDTKFNSIKIVFDSEPAKSNMLDVTYEHIWVLHITAEHTVIFTNERIRNSLCINIGTNKDITIRSLSFQRVKDLWYQCGIRIQKNIITAFRLSTYFTMEKIYQMKLLNLK